VPRYLRALYAYDEAGLRELSTEAQGERWIAAMRRFRREGQRRELERIEHLEATVVGLENRSERVRATIFVDGIAIYSWHQFHAGDPFIPGPATLLPTVVTRIQLGRLVAEVGDTGVHELRGYWTLERRSRGWIVLGTFDERQGGHLLERDVVAVPWSDRRADETHPPAPDDAGLVLPGDPLPAPSGVVHGPRVSEMLRRLSEIDPRTHPDVIERIALDAMEAWSEASAGDEAPLRAATTPAVFDLLLARDHQVGTELAVREVEVARCEIAAFEPAAAPPWVGVDLLVRAYWYRRIIGTDYSQRSLGESGRVPERWTDPGEQFRRTALWVRLRLTLDGEGRWPWRISEASIRRATL
jgi:hypothetical protein